MRLPQGVTRPLHNRPRVPAAAGRRGALRVPPGWARGPPSPRGEHLVKLPPAWFLDLLAELDSEALPLGGAPQGGLLALRGAAYPRGRGTRHASRRRRRACPR
ncbi:protein of unknown function [Blastococcus saxobsidens DD2]|uniref:Uncharacterized protein n=1 Tax=Blastococcus saxobsidens (strain DD2) TaxID=1146883 RepID=H6RNT8_BLASD|nr:protein of unknown function [Blastococcus saxobsidens DD2]